MVIVVHFRRSRFLPDIGLIALVGLLFGIISYLLTYVKINPAPILFAILFFGAWPWLWRIFRVIFCHQPALVITAAGIRLFPVHIPGSYFIRWSEIQKISIERYNAENCLCIHAKDENGFFTRFSFFRRLIIRLWNFKGQIFMNISLAYLDKPVADVFRELSSEYENELQEYNILLQP